MSEADPIVEVEARGMRCPLPVLRLQRAAALHPPPARLRLLCDDPAARADVPAYVRERGWAIVLAADERPPYSWTILTA